MYLKISNGYGIIKAKMRNLDQITNRDDLTNFVENCWKSKINNFQILIQ